MFMRSGQMQRRWLGEICGDLIRRCVLALCFKDLAFVYLMSLVISFVNSFLLLGYKGLQKNPYRLAALFPPKLLPERCTGRYSEISAMALLKQGESSISFYSCTPYMVILRHCTVPLVL